jgi:hypothetical protein
MDNAPKMMTLKCRHGDGHEWTRPSQKGKPPHFCPEHRPAKPERVSFKPKPAPVKVEALVSDGEDISPAELQARAEREAAIRARTEKALATKAAKKAAEEAAQAERNKETLTRLETEIDKMFARYDTAFEKAMKENTKQAWNAADSAQMACLNTRAAIRNLKAEVNV